MSMPNTEKMVKKIGRNAPRKYSIGRKYVLPWKGSEVRFHCRAVLNREHYTTARTKIF